MARSPLAQLAACAVTVVAGLGSRRPELPSFVLAYMGDALYAVLIFLLLGLVRPRAPALRLAAGAWLVCALVEGSQALHPAWLDELRAHRLAALVLGRGFLWADLVCYAVGVVLAAALERGLGRDPALRGG